MDIVILGGGLAGISLAYFLQSSKKIDHITILEKEGHTGGLCHSIHKDGYVYDIGPHILFSKDKEILEFMLSVLDVGKNDLRRSNQIIHKKRWVQYPFENDLSKLPKEDLEYCINAFNNNPYENYDANNMLQFFLKTFGEGITNTYLRPYNEKIWKYDPCYMNTSMVERIPKPTREEIQRSASGETVDGYIHQLYFHFPKDGGIEAVVDGIKRRLTDKCEIVLNANISSVIKEHDGYGIFTAEGRKYYADKLISTIPVQEITNIYNDVPIEVKTAVADLRYNSILIAFVKTREDLCGDNFAFMIADKNVIFHRISKMDFLGERYKSDGATYMIEITYRDQDQIDRMDEEVIENSIKSGLKEIGFIRELNDATILNITRHQYAYVIYDINHTKNMDIIRKYYKSQDILLHGRFGNFEYWNMDKVIRESKNVAERFVENIE
ncbi:MAG: protoporphyrinogen/coproporphyrinogen oxidase [Lachnospiraceae bacterium]